MAELPDFESRWVVAVVGGAVLSAFLTVTVTSMLVDLTLYITSLVIVTASAAAGSMIRLVAFGKSSTG